MNKRSAASLVLICQLASLISCGEARDLSVENETEEVTTESAPETDYLDTLPEKDYEGYQFRVIAQSYDQRPNLPLYEEENGEVLNDAIIQRNRKVEEWLNIEFVNMPYENRDDVSNLVKNTVMADDDAYDLVITSVNFGINTLLYSGCLFDLSRLDYLDLSQEWWCQSIYNDYQINGHLYFTSGPLSPFYFYMPSGVAYNKTMTDNHGITGLEQLVLDGGWTFDKLKEYTANVSYDLNGDGNMTEDDYWAIAGSAGDAYFLGGFGQRMVKRDENGDFALNMNSIDFLECFDAVASYVTDKSVFYDSSDTKVFLSMFQADRAMFMPTSMNNIITGYETVPSCREMVSDYGILPLPKYDESQTEYYSCAQPAGPSGIAVPATCNDSERTSLIMEVMAYYSDSIIRDAAYESVVKGKSLRIEESAEVLDIIYNSVYFDMNYVFNFGNTKTLLDNELKTGGGTFASKYASQEKAAEAGLEEYYEIVSSLE